MNRQRPRWQFQTISLNSRNLSGLRHKYDDVRCAQFGLWRGARRAHPRPGAVTDEQRSHRPNWAQPEGRQLFFAQTSLLAPYRSTAGYARRSRLVCAKNPLPRKLTDLRDRTLGAEIRKALPATHFGIDWSKALGRFDPHLQNETVKRHKRQQMHPPELQNERTRHAQQ